uniref:Uncharacterized protein n=1 Tax=Salix viminalis TaxID=40686 RepID=A0A6N2LEV2_SALVM
MVVKINYIINGLPFLIKNKDSGHSMFGAINCTFMPFYRRSGCGDGFVGRGSSSATLPSIPDGQAPKYPERGGKHVNARHIPSVTLCQPVEAKEGKDTVTNPPSKKQKRTHGSTCVLVQLKEDNKLEPGPMQRSEKMPVKELMEKCYPTSLECFLKIRRANEFLYCQYWLLLFEILKVRIGSCRVQRKQLEYVGREECDLNKDNKSGERIASCSKKEGQEAELDKRGNQIEGMAPEIETLSKPELDQDNSQGELNKHPSTALEQEFAQVILEHHKKMLECKEEEERRLDRVLEKINQLLQDKDFP